jgi:hypothetical protein
MMIVVFWVDIMMDKRERLSWMERGLIILGVISIRRPRLREAGMKRGDIVIIWFGWVARKYLNSTISPPI